METIKLLLAHADRRVTNQIEVAVLDVCYDRAVVQSTRTARLEEAVRQGSLWDFDLIIIGAGNLFADRAQQAWAGLEAVAEGIRTIRSQSSAPIVALSGSPEWLDTLREAGAHSVLRFPFNADQLKAEVRPLLDLNGHVETAEPNRWSSLGSLFKGFQKASN
jgi:DNA-binding response OmpR family regulator